MTVDYTASDCKAEVFTAIICFLYSAGQQTADP